MIFSAFVFVDGGDVGFSVGSQKSVGDLCYGRYLWSFTTYCDVNISLFNFIDFHSRKRISIAKSKSLLFRYKYFCSHPTRPAGLCESQECSKPIIVITYGHIKYMRSIRIHKFIFNTVFFFLLTCILCSFCGSCFWYAILSHIFGSGVDNARIKSNMIYDHP